MKLLLLLLTSTKNIGSVYKKKHRSNCTFKMVHIPNVTNLFLVFMITVPYLILAGYTHYVSKKKNYGYIVVFF